VRRATQRGMAPTPEHFASHPARHIADLLSFANLAFGAVSIAWALRGHYLMSLLFVALGAICDGLDGAAARRWGGTRFGVLADDIADGVTYGIAPGVAIWSFFGGLEGIALGVVYALFTITRLVHFTLNKSTSDPRYFQGIPSTLGGIAVLCALVACAEHPLLAGVAVGAVCMKLVAFSTRYRHAGRWFTEQPRLRQRLVAMATGLTALFLAIQPAIVSSLLLVGLAVYALWPSFKSVGHSLKRSVAPQA
jgi:CDP-diacylglycerol--serine O-phosphatidyltransferase